MKHKNHFHCETCGETFAKANDLKEHETLRHPKQGAGGAGSKARSEEGEQNRKNRTFTRSHKE
jgi:hypothetical protein